MTLDLELTRWLNLSANIAFLTSKRSQVNGDLMRNTFEYFPILPAYPYPNEEEFGIYAGKWPQARDFNVGENRPGATFMLDQQEGYYRDNQFTGGFVLNAKITKDLSFETNFSVDSRDRMSRWFSGTFEGRDRGDANGEHLLWRYWQSENYFNYNKTIGDHAITGLLGFSWSENNYDRIYARRKQIFHKFLLNGII